MPTRLPRTVAGWDSIFASLKLALQTGKGGWPMIKALLSKNSCKSCALGMGGQRGGMRDEKGRFPQVCKKSFYAQASDMQPPLPDDFHQRHDIATLRHWSPLQLEHAGRLTQPLLSRPGETHFQAVSWDEALNLVTERMRSVTPERSFFYASGRSSNEAGFLLQLLARAYGTNNVNNCSYYCHQASGVGLNQSLGTGTATIRLDDLDATDMIFLMGANPASNHPRLMTTLLDIRRRGGKVIVVNPARERGLENFSVPSDFRSLLFGSRIATTYLQPHIGGDLAFMTGMAKALLTIARTRPEVIDRAFIEGHTEQFDAYRDYVENADWAMIEAESGLTREEIEKAAHQYADANNAVFAWAMGITHHTHGVQNVQSIVNLALLRGMVGRPYAGLLPIRGHSNVQGIGTVGVTPQLKQEFLDNLERLYGITVPGMPGLDTLACMEAAARGEFDFAWNLGGNLFGSNPDSRFAEDALKKIDFVLYMNTTLNQSHVRGRGNTTLILPVLARDEEPQATTQESMFNYIRLSEGGLSRYTGPRSEVDIICDVARRVLPDSPVPWDRFASNTEIREMIGSVVKGLRKMKHLDRTREEFHIEGRILHQPEFPRPSKKAVFTVPPPLHSPAPRDPNQFKLMTVRSEGQFNTVVYELQDRFRGVDRRNVVFINEEDLKRLGRREGDRVRVRNATGTMNGQILIAYPVRSGNLIMYYPEANVLVPRAYDAASKTPSFKSVDVWIDNES